MRRMAVRRKKERKIPSLAEIRTGNAWAVESLLPNIGMAVGSTRPA
jgi:hypothetical protein